MFAAMVYPDDFLRYDLSAGLFVGGRGVRGKPYHGAGVGTQRDAATSAGRAWNDLVSATAPPPGEATFESRNSILVSRVGESIGRPVELQLTYASRSGDIFTEANLRAVLAAEEAVRRRPGFSDVCARDASQGSAADRDLPPCKPTDTALRACASPGGCAATDIGSSPAGILREEGALDMAYAEARLKAYAAAVHAAGTGTAERSTNASDAARAFQAFVGPTFGRRAAAVGTMLASRFQFGTPLPGYANSRDRPEEQEGKVFAFAAAAGKAAAAAALEASNDIEVGFACSGGEGGDGCRSLREWDAVRWVAVAGAAAAGGLTALVAAAHSAPLFFTVNAVHEALGRAALVLLHAMACAGLAAVVFRSGWPSTTAAAVDPLASVLTGLAVLRLGTTEALAMVSATRRATTPSEDHGRAMMEALPPHGSAQWHVAAEQRVLTLLRGWWRRSGWAAAGSVVGCLTTALYSPVAAATTTALALSSAALAVALASHANLSPVLVLAFRRRLDPGRRKKEGEREKRRRARREARARRLQEELDARREALTWAAAVSELAAVEYRNAGGASALPDARAGRRDGAEDAVTTFVHPRVADEHDWSVVYLQREYWRGPDGVRNTMEGAAEMDRVGKWEAPPPVEDTPDDDVEEDDVEVLALPSAPSAPEVRAPPPASTGSVSPSRWAGYEKGVWTVYDTPPKTGSGPGPVTESRITAAGGGGVSYVGTHDDVFDDDSRDPWAGSKYARGEAEKEARERAAAQIRLMQMSDAIPGLRPAYVAPWDDSGQLVAKAKPDAEQALAPNGPLPFKIRRWDEDDDEDGGNDYGKGKFHVTEQGNVMVNMAPGEGDLSTYALDKPQFHARSPGSSESGSWAEDELIRHIRRLDPDAKSPPPALPLPPKPQPAAAAPKAGFVRNKWKAAVSKVMNAEDVRAQWAKLRDAEHGKKSSRDIGSLREAAAALLDRDRKERTHIPAPPPPEAIDEVNKIRRAFAAAVQAEVDAEARLVEAEDQAEDNNIELRDTGEAVAETYGRLVSTFRWGTSLLALAVAVGTLYLVVSGPAVAAAARPPSFLPSDDYAAVFHAAAVQHAGPLTLTPRGDAARVRLAFGVDPAAGGDGTLLGGDLATGRASVGAACVAAACDAADELAATAVGGGGNVTATSCWVRDLREYVRGAAGRVLDECQATTVTFPTWESMTGCPSSCDCRPVSASAAKNSSDPHAPKKVNATVCASDVDRQERAFWGAVRAYVASSGAEGNAAVSTFLLRPAAAHAASPPVQTCAGAAADAALAASGHVTAAEIRLTATWRTLPRAAILDLERAWAGFWANLWVPHPTDHGEYEESITAAGVHTRVEKRAPVVMLPRQGNVTACAAVAGVYGGVQYSPAPPGWSWRDASGWVWADWARRGFFDIAAPAAAAVGAATTLPVGAMTRSVGLTVAAALAGVVALALAAMPGVLGLDHADQRSAGGGGGGSRTLQTNEVSVAAIASLLAVPAVVAPWLVHMAASYLEALRAEEAEVLLGKRKRHRLLPWRMRLRRRDRLRRRCTCAMLRDAGLVVAQSAAAALAAAGGVAAAVPAGTFVAQLAVHHLATVAGAAITCLLVFPALAALMGPTFEPPHRPQTPLEVVGTNPWKGQLPLKGNVQDDADAVSPFSTPGKRRRKVFKQGVGVVDEDLGEENMVMSPREQWMAKKMAAKQRAQEAKMQAQKMAPMAVMEAYEDGTLATAV